MKVSIDEAIKIVDPAAPVSGKRKHSTSGKRRRRRRTAAGHGYIRGGSGNEPRKGTESRTIPKNL